MSEEVAAIGIKLDTDGVEKGIKALDTLAAQGGKVESALGKIEQASVKTGKTLGTLGGGSSQALDALGKSGATAAEGMGKLGSAGKQAEAALGGQAAAAKSAASSFATMQAAVASFTDAEKNHIQKLVDEAKQLGMTRGEREAYIAQSKGMSEGAQQVAAAVGRKIEAYKSEQQALGGVTGATHESTSAMLGLMRTGVVAFLGSEVVSAARAAGSAMFEASAAGERLRTVLNFSTGGNSTREIEYLRSVTQRLGLEFTSTAQAYGSFQAAAKGTALEGQKARDVFESMAKASAVMGLSADQSRGVLLALQQMISKGTVQAEELRGQLGERLPGAFQVAAKAMGVTTAELGKMLEQGQVIADDFLPKFARAMDEHLGGAAEKAATRLDAAVNRFDNAWQRLKQSAGDSGVSRAMGDGLEAISRDLMAVTDAMETTKQTGGGMWAEIGSGAAVAAGRVGFSTLNLLANTLNGSINAVTGSVLGLRTDLALLPDSLKTAAQQAAVLANDIGAAEARMKRLKELDAMPSNGDYYKSQIRETGTLIAKLQEAYAIKSRLGGIDPVGAGGGRGSINPPTVAEDNARLAGVQSAMGKVLGNLSGVKENFFKDLNSLYAGYQSGLINLADYQANVAKLINKEGVEKAKSTGGSATAGQSEVASIQAKVIETQRYIDALKTQGLEGAKLNEGEKLVIKIQEELAGSLKGAARANKEKALAAAEGLAVLLKSADAETAFQKAIKQSADEYAKLIDATYKSADSITEQAAKQEAANASFGKGKTAIEAMTLAELKHQMTEAQGSDRFDEKYIKALDAKIAAQERYTKALYEADYTAQTRHTDELLRSSKELGKMYADEAKLTGLSAIERSKVVALRQVEIKYAKELADLDKKTFSSDVAENDRMKEAERLKIYEAKQIESSAAVNKVVQDDWQKTADQINQSLTDAIMRGGKSGADYLKDLFRTMVLRPIISAVMAPVSGVINGVVNAGLNAVGLGSGGGGGVMGMVNNASSLNTLYSQGSNLYSVGSQYFGGAMSGANAYGTIASNLGYGGGGIDGLLATNGAYGTALGSSASAIVASNTALASTIGISTSEAAAAALAAEAAGGTAAAAGPLAAAGPVGWIALAALAAYAIFATGGDERFGSQGSWKPDTGTESNGGPNGADDNFGAVSEGNKSTAETINKILGKVGSKDKLDYFAGGFESSKNDNGFSYAGGILSNGKVFGQGTDGLGYQNLRGSMSPEEGQARYANELKQSMLEALQVASDIPKAISGKLDGIDIESLAQKDLDALVGVIDKIITEVDLFSAAIENLPIKNLQDLSFDTTAALIEAAGGLQKLSEGTAFIFQNLYSESERAAVGTNMLAAQFAALGLAVPESDAALRQLIESQDLTTESGRNLAISVGGLAPAFVAAANAARAAAQNMLSVMADYASQGEQKAFAVEQIRQGLADGGLNISADQIGSATRDQAWQLYKDQLAAGNLQQADAIKNQLAAFAKITQPTNAGNMMGGSGSSGGSSVGGSSSALDAWQSATDAIVQTMKDLRQTLIGDGPNAMAQLQAQFAIESAKASAGDLEAYKGLPTLAKALANTGQNYSSSALEQALLTARIIESLGNVVQARTGEKVPGFASGGYHSGGWAMVGENGPELANFSSPARIYSAADTKSLQGGDNAETIAELREQNRLLSELLAAGLRTAGNTGKAAKTLDDAAAGVAPLTTIAA